MKSVRMLLLCVNIAIVVLVAGTIGLTARAEMKSQVQTSLKLYREALYGSYDDSVKYQIQNVIDLLQGIYDRQLAGELTEDEAKHEAVTYVKALRYGDDESGYFWIDDLDYVLVAHPILEEQEGTNRYGLEDPNGVKIIQTILSTVQQNEAGGFNEFYFTKADGVTVAPKRAYSKLFQPWGWAVSTGNYIDDMEAVYEKEKEEMNAKLTRQVQITNLCVAVMLVFAAVLSIIYAQFFTRPLRRIRDFAERLSNCDFSKPLEDKSKNEFGQTAQTLDYAQEKLKSYIMDVSRQLGEMSRGNFNVSSAVEYHGEFRQIQASMETIVSSMNQTLLEINRAAEQVSEGAGQVSEGTRFLASATVQQAGSMEEVSEHMNSISSQAQQNSANAQQAKDCAVQTKQHIETGMRKMAELSEAIRNILTASGSIEKINKTINDIAFQTNLLALNASVEAVHAGAAGKGFAVVADEVCSLAERSSEAAKVSQELIADCQQAVHSGKKVAEDMEAALAAIVEKNKETRELVEDIAADSGKQAGDCGYVNEKIGSVSDVTQKNAETVRQSASSSEKLRQQADIMKHLVGQFQLKR